MGSTGDRKGGALASIKEYGFGDDFLKHFFGEVMAVHMETSVGDCLFDMLNLVHTDIRGIVCSCLANFSNVLTLDFDYYKLVFLGFHSVCLIQIA